MLLEFVEDHPDLDRGLVAQTYYGLGRYERVVPPLRAELDSAEGIDRLRPAAMLVMSLEALGRYEEASGLEWILSDFDGTSVDPNRRWAAVVEASRRNAPEAVRLLLEAYRAGAWYYHSGQFDGSFMHVRPEFESIRDDPGFQRLVAPR